MFTHFVSSRSDNSCLRCLESSFFSMERRTQALAFPTSVLISLIFWMCLQTKRQVQVYFYLLTNLFLIKYSASKSVSTCIICNCCFQTEPQFAFAYLPQRSVRASLVSSLRATIMSLMSRHIPFHSTCAVRASHLLLFHLPSPSLSPPSTLTNAG